MKKVVISLVLLAFAFPASSLTLFEWYSGRLPRCAERAPLYRSFFPSEDYRCTKEQNIRFISALTGGKKEGGLLLGGSAVGGEVYRLSGSGISSSATTINLTSFTVPGGDTKYAMSDFGELGCGTIEPGNATRQEYVSFTGVTQNSDDTAQLTGVSRGLPPVGYPYTASTTLQRAHAGATQFVLSNSPCFYGFFANRTASTTIQSRWFFDVHPEAQTGLAVATTSRQYITKAYADALVNQGAATSTESNGGIVELATRTEVASTTESTTARPLVVQAQHATSTPGANITAAGGTGETYVVVSEDDGKLNQNWLDLTESITYTGSVTLNATSTLASTTVTDFSASATSANPVRLNGVALSVKNAGTAPAASTTAQFDSDGSMIFDFLDMQEIREPIHVTTSTTSVGVANIPARRVIGFLIHNYGKDAAQGMEIQFNGDTTGTYGSTRMVNGGTPTQSSGITGAIISAATSTPEFIALTVTNLATAQKQIRIEGTSGNSGAVAPDIFHGASIWNNTSAQITRATLYNGSSAAFDNGVTIRIYGTRD